MPAIPRPACLRRKGFPSSPRRIYIDKGENYKVNKVDIAVETGDAADEILITAKKHAADLIVVGYKGYGKEGRFLLGSVTDKVVRHASISVMVVR